MASNIAAGLGRIRSHHPYRGIEYMGKKQTFARARQPLDTNRPSAPVKREAPRDFEYDLLLMFVRNETVAALTVPILAVVIAVTMLNWSAPRQLLLWLATI